MKVLFDTNVLLDVLLERAPYVGVASKLLALVDNGHLDGAVCATSVTTLYYIGAKDLGRARTRDSLGILLGMFDVARVDRDVLQRALAAEGFADFEDAVIHEAADAAGADAIVTRDTSGFAGATLPVMDPPSLLAAVAASRS